MNMLNLQNWIGKTEEATATIAVETANLMNATLNREPIFEAGESLPPAWHWLYFHDAVQGVDLGVEGHAKLGGFMPPVSLGGDEPPRRMWAGGTLAFHVPIPLGTEATKRSTVKSITPKSGRSGNLVFVVVGHEIRVEGQTCLVEEQTIVYREPVQSDGSADGAMGNPTSGATSGTTSGPTVAAQPAPDDGDFSVAYQPDPMMLFRYSALTFNAHRIHYDVDFCRSHEGYPGLVVHGPLTATLLLDLFYHQVPERVIQRFEYRGRSPLFNPQLFTVNGKADGSAWASNHEGGLAMSAQVSFA